MTPPQNLILEQKAFLKGFQRFEIHQDGNLEITLKRLDFHRQFKLPLWQVIPEPERILHSQTGDLIAFIFFGLLAVLLIVPLIVSSNPVIGGALLFPAVLIAILSIACFRRWKTKAVDVLCFYTRQGGQFHLWHEKPNAKTFETFCELLKEKAQAAWLNRPIDPSQQSLAGEIAAVKKLKDEGILTEAEFEKAKSKLLSTVEEKRIGFI